MENMTETKARFFRENPRAEMNFEVVQTEYLKWLEDLARKQLAYNDALQLVRHCGLIDKEVYYEDKKHGKYKVLDWCEDRRKFFLAGGGHGFYGDPSKIISCA